MNFTVMNEQPSDITQRVRVMQIINAALIMGVVFFAVIVVFVMDGLGQPAGGMMMSILGAGFAGMAIVIHFIVPNILVVNMTKEHAEKFDADGWCGVYQTKLIIGLAILEGAAFFNVIVVQMEHQWFPLAIAGVLLFWMLVQFPTETRVRQWIESRQMTE